MTPTLFVNCVQAWPSQLAFVWWGAPLMTLHKKQAQAAVCRSGHFPRRRLAQGSLHNSFVYSVASRRSLKGGQAVERERSKTEWVSLF